MWRGGGIWVGECRQEEGALAATPGLFLLIAQSSSEYIEWVTCLFYLLSLRRPAALKFTGTNRTKCLYRAPFAALRAAPFSESPASGCRQVHQVDASDRRGGARE